MDAEKLVMMINQIADFHRRRPPDQAAADIATHVERYWERRMRQAAVTYAEADGAGLCANAAAALKLVAEREANINS